MSKSLRLLAAVAAVCILAVLTQAQIQPNKAASYKEKVLHAFTGKSDGFLPEVLLQDAKGDLYGSTAFGGSLVGQCGSGYFSNGCGVLFKISARGKFSVLHTFHFRDGAWPTTLIRDSNGNLYGIGAGGNSACQDGGCGVIFKLTPGGGFTLLYSFTGGSDGRNPNTLIMDDQGNFYGTTDATPTEVFELTNSGDLKVLYVFGDGAFPNGVIRDSSGNLYGTSRDGGAYGYGTVFKLDTNSNETVLYSFKGESDGGNPAGGLVMDKTGNLFGTTLSYGYEKGACYQSPPYIPGCGTVFEVNTAGVFSVLFPFHFFDGDGGGRLKASADGTIYGTTYWGGGSCRGGCGVAFKVTPNGKESVLYTFKGGSKGSLPGSIVGDSTGNLYGTTLWGGDLSCPYGAGVGCGLVFELTP